MGRNWGCGAELGVFGPTKGVATDGRGEIFYIKEKIPPSAYFSILSAQIACFRQIAGIRDA